MVDIKQIDKESVTEEKDNYDSMMKPLSDTRENRLMKAV